MQLLFQVVLFCQSVQVHCPIFVVVLMFLSIGQVVSKSCSGFNFVFFCFFYRGVQNIVHMTSFYIVAFMAVFKHRCARSRPGTIKRGKKSVFHRH